MPALSKGLVNLSKANPCSTKKMKNHQTMLVRLQKLKSFFFKSFRNLSQRQNLLHQQRMGAENISTSVETIYNIGTKNYPFKKIGSLFIKFVYNI